MMMKIIFFILAGITASRAQYDAYTAYEFANTDQDENISNDEFETWAKAVAFYKQTETIFTFTGPITVPRFREVLQSHSKPTDPYSVDDAVQFADSDWDGEIDAAEFDKYYQTVTQFKVSVGEYVEDKTATIFLFIGEIPVPVFWDVLEEYEKSHPSTGSGYTVEDAVNNADDNGDNVISYQEFNDWYNDVNYWWNQQLLTQMAGPDGVISKDEFINVLTYIAQNY